MSVNRRKHERRVPNKLAFCQLERDDGGAILNISEGGLAFESFAPLPRSEPINFWFSLDMKSRIEATGRLTWINGARTSGGMAFVDLSAQGAAHIRAWMKQSGKAATDPPSSRNRGLGGPVRTRKKWPLIAAENPDTHPHESLAVATPELGTPPAELTELQHPERTLETDAAADPARAQFHTAQLIPIERFRSATRKNFVKGAFWGVALASLIVSGLSGYSKGRNHRADVVATADAPAPAAADLPGSSAIAKGGRSGSPLVQQNPPEVVVPIPVEKGRQSAAVPFTDYAGVTKPPEQVRRVPMTTADLQARRSGQAPFDAATGKPTRLSPARPRLQPANSVGTSSASQIPAQSERTQGSLSPRTPPTPQQLWASVQAGSAQAAVTLAGLYLRGEGVAMNCDQARALLQMASEKKNPQAARMLSEMDQAGCSSPAR
jgi:PilZ domain